MNAPRWLKSVLALAVACGAGGGCGSGAGETAEEHAEHLVSAHRPADFPAAARRLRALHALLVGEPAAAAAARSADGPRDDVSAWRETVDLVRWLPELAAESDLPRAKWERAADLARKWRGRLESLDQNAPTDPPAAYRQARAEVDKLLAELEAIAREPAFQHPGGA